jgi:GT2 family glycosyltransferase
VKTFSVVILSRNSVNLWSCVGAIMEHEEGPFRIIHVDDGCSDKHPNVETIQGVKPFCFARNANIGIEAAGTDDVILINDDAMLQVISGFSLLADVAREHPEYGLIASSCNNVGNRSQLRIGTGLRDEPRMVCFVCVYIPRATIDQVGLLDERFTCYGMDDDDYCLRVRQAGMKLGIFDGCFCDHSQMHSSFRGPGGAGGNYQSNLELFKQKWGVDNWGRPA